MTKSIAKYLRRYLVLSLCLFLWVSTIAAVLAQDETPPVEPPSETPTELPTATLTPTFTPSEPPTFTSTSQPTATETPSPTPTPTATETIFVTESPAVTAEFTDTPSGTPSLTLEPSLTLTPTTSVTPSATPTGTTTPTSTPLPPEPPLTLLFADTFDTAPLPIWTFGSGWSVVASEGGQAALQAIATEEATTLTFDTLFNVVVQVRTQFNTGALRLFVRESEVGSYSVTLDTLGNVSLYRAGVLFGIGTADPASPDQWRTLRLSVINDAIRVSVDGVEVLALGDAAPLPPGTLGFAGVQLSEQALLVDDVEVWLPSSELPTPTPPPTEVAPIGLSAQALQAVTGRDIAFMNGVNFMTSSVQVLDGNGNTILTRNGGFPEWSITEKYLAYLSTAPQVNRHNFETNETEALGNTTTLILPRINGTFWDPVWSPSTTNNQIAFVWSRETDRVDIYVMSADGTNVRNLTSTSPDPINFLPAWSPDGDWIAFTSTVDGTSYRVRLVPANGGSIITINTGAASALLPFWAGDGSRLAFWVIATDPTNPSFAMVTFNSSTGAIGSVQAFNPGTTDWGRVWVPGGGQYASMASFNPTTRVFQLLYSGDGSLIGTGWFPKWRPTYEPWVITVSPDALIPPIARETDQECPLLIDNTIPEQGIACALRTYREYGASLTWTQLVALILHAEGNSLLISSTGCTDNTFPGIPAPLASQPTPPAPTPTPTPIPLQVNFVAAPCNPTVHREFAHAVVEQMFNKCDDPNDVADKVGQCSEEGLLLFLGGVQRYRENNISDPFTYEDLARERIEFFLADPQRFGVCPCTTGNVDSETLARRGQVRIPSSSYQAYAENPDFPGYWYSYSYYDNGTGANPSFRYLKIY